MNTWMTPDWESIAPDSVNPSLKWIGSALMDEEQYHLERWEVNEQGYWRASIAGMNEYAALRRRRKDDRKAAWAAREASLDEYSEQMSALVEEHFGDAA